MAYLGSWTLTKSEKFDEFMQALGVGMIKRKLGNSVTPTIHVTEEDGTITAKTTTAVKNSEISFKFGEEFEELRQDDVKVKSVVKLDGNKWIHTQTPLAGDTDKVVTIERVFDGNLLKVTATVSGVSSYREYTKK